MNLTPEGAAAAMLGEPERAKHADQVLGGTNINKYTNGVCYDAAAYVRFLLGNGFSQDELLQKSGGAWLNRFNFLLGTRWNGKKAIEAGKAVGFYRPIDQKVFHAAIAVGGTSIRAVNGHSLGQGWQKVDLKDVLGEPDDKLEFDYDNTKIQVWISKA